MGDRFAAGPQGAPWGRGGTINWGIFKRHFWGELLRHQHLKDDHRMRRNYLKGRDGDRINAVLAAAGYNFSLLRRWFEDLLRVLLSIFCHGGTTLRPA